MKQVNNIHLLSFAIDLPYHFVHSTWTQTCSNGIGNSCNEINIH